MAPESTAGGLNPLVREEALARARGQIKRFADTHPEFRVQANGKHSPTEYRFKFSAKGFGPPQEAGPLLIEEHSVWLVMPPDFPMKAPQVYWRTPIFHPNIHPDDGSVCLGLLQDHYRPALDMEELCKILVEMATYRNYDLGGVYNTEAAEWAGSEQGQAAIEERGGVSLLRRVMGVFEQQLEPPPPLRVKSLDLDQHTARKE
jgi:ubiquitin-protein ligase